MGRKSSMLVVANYLGDPHPTLIIYLILDGCVSFGPARYTHHLAVSRLEGRNGDWRPLADPAGSELFRPTTLYAL